MTAKLEPAPGYFPTPTSAPAFSFASSARVLSLLVFLLLNRPGYLQARASLGSNRAAAGGCTIDDWGRNRGVMGLAGANQDGGVEMQLSPYDINSSQVGVHINDRRQCYGFALRPQAENISIVICSSTLHHLFITSTTSRT